MWFEAFRFCSKVSSKCRKWHFREPNLKNVPHDTLLSLDVALCSCKTFSFYQKFISGLLILRNATGKRRQYGKLAASIFFQTFNGWGYPRLVRKYMLYGLQRRVRSIAAVNWKVKEVASSSTVGFCPSTKRINARLRITANQAFSSANRRVIRLFFDLGT